jgi:signal transduction histidine kinase
MPEPEARFTYIFASELYERLRWFVQLRWLAAVGLASASLLGPNVGLSAVWPSLFLVATIVALYNLLFYWRLRGRTADVHPYANLRANAILQMVMDLAALLATVSFTGGLRSPLLMFFAFHMAIGTIMIATRIMYLLAGMTSLGALGLYLLQVSDVFGSNNLGHDSANWDTTSSVNLAALSLSMFGIVYLTDSVTSRFKQRNIDLYRATREMEELERRKSHYMRISAHQLRSPLATIKTSLQVLIQGYVDLSSERADRLIRGAVGRANGLLAIVTDLLNLAKIREARGKAEWSRRIMLHQLLADLLHSQRQSAERQGVELVYDFEGVAVLEWGVASDLANAFENLISNAIKYSRPGGIVLVQLRTAGGAAVVQVADEGIGIPAESLDEVFLEFVRTPSARRHAPDGTGLGLAIVKEAIDAHHGVIRVKSREGEGSSFTVTLPLNSAPPTGVL